MTVNDRVLAAFSMILDEIYHLEFSYLKTLSKESLEELEKAQRLLYLLYRERHTLVLESLLQEAKEKSDDRAGL